AWKAALEPIAASGATVIIALLCLLFSDLNSNKSLGPIAAIGIVFALLATLTLLPMLLALFGRAAFWPFRPKLETEEAHPSHAAEDQVRGLEGVSGLWRRVGRLIARRPRVTWVVSLLVLVAGGLGLLQLQASGVPQTDLVLSQSQAADGQKLASKHFPSGAGSPVVIVTRESKASDMLDAVESTKGVDSASVYAGNVRPGTKAEPIVKDGRVLIDAVLSYQADSAKAEAVVKTLRSELPKTDSTVLVGGVTAIAYDTNTTAQGDLVKIIPIVLVVILLILMLLLRSILAPVLLILSVVVSYAAGLGV